jgi:hypothetical protein
MEEYVFIVNAIERAIMTHKKAYGEDIAIIYRPLRKDNKANLTLDIQINGIAKNTLGRL